MLKIDHMLIVFSAAIVYHFVVIISSDLTRNNNFTNEGSGRKRLQKEIQEHSMSKASPQMSDVHLPKCPSGIAGLDQITEGGLPRGRPTLVCGNTGCGKTLFALEFLIRGA